MKKLISIVIVIVMTVSLFAVCANAEDETVKLIIGSEEAAGPVTPSGVTVEQSGSGVIATTGESNDPWISVELPNVDTAVYKFFTVTYRCDSEIGSNNTYMKVAGYIGNPDGGDWEPNGMGGTADGEWHTIEYSMEGFPTFADTEITGIRLTCCGAQGGKFEVASIRFTETHYEPEEQPGETSQPSQPSNPTTADASVIAVAAVACIALAGVVVAKKVR